MGQIIRCPLLGVPCSKRIIIEEKTIFLAEAEEPEYDRQRRRKAISEAIGNQYKIRSALDEKGINAFTCKTCEMIQTCAYGIADITQSNANALLELGMMLALGKPTILLLKKGHEPQLRLPSDVVATEIVIFEEYLDILDQLREVVPKLPPAVSPPSLIQDLEKMQPRFADELKKMADDIVREFKESVEAANLDTVALRDEKIAVSLELSQKIDKMKEKLDGIVKLGFTIDAKTAFLRGNYYYNRGKYNEALAAYNWSLELSSDDPATLCNRGTTYGELGRYEEALADYNRSLELSPDDADTMCNRGTIYYKLGRYEEALADYNRSLELRPHDPTTLYNRGTTYTKLRKYVEALADYNRSLELRLDQPSTLYNAACLLSLWGKPDSALTYLEKAIRKDEKYRQMAKTDEDFANVRDDVRFKRLAVFDYFWGK
jgi:tetratricopeptide (TPR) repeat protein